MLLHRRKRHIEAIGELLRWRIAHCEQVQQPPPIRISDRMKDPVVPQLLHDACIII
jgi:hypothetical protein